MAEQNLLPLIEAVRAEYPAALLSKAEVAAATYEIARRAGREWGVLLKPHGTNGPSPVGLISLDILVHIPTEQEYDIWASADGENGAPGPAIPVFHKLDFKVGVPPSGASMNRVLAVADLTLPPGDEEADVNDAKPQPPAPHQQPAAPLLDVSLLEQRIVAAIIGALQPQLALTMGAAAAARAAAEDAAEIVAQERDIELKIPYFGMARGVIKEA